jgi:hypothetical protein
MIKIPILPEEIVQAKETIAEFDCQKTFDKFKCKNNFIGVLGEIVFNRYLLSKNISFTWVDYVKQGWDSPDFIIDGESVDIKTTTSCKMWIQEPKFDKYIFCRVNDCLEYLYILSVIDKKLLDEYISKGLLEVVKRENRQDYTVTLDQMKSIELYFAKLGVVL